MLEDGVVMQARLKASSGPLRSFGRALSDAAEVLDTAAATIPRIPELVAAVAQHESNAAIAEEAAERARAQQRRAEADHAATVARIQAEERVTRERIEGDIFTLTQIRDGLERQVSELRSALADLHARTGVAVGGA
jgi:hypothetical protein